MTPNDLPHPVSESEVPWTYARAVIEFTKAVIDTESVEEVLWLLTDDIVQDLGFEDCVVYLMDEVRSKLVQRAAYGNKKSGNAEVLNPIELDLGEGITGRCAAEQQPILVNDVSKDPSYVRDDKVRMSELAVPILSGGAVIGVIDSEHSSKNFYNSQHVATLKALSSIITTRYENSRALRDLRESEAKLRHLANFDPLSKLPNRHNFMDTLATAARRCDEGELTSIAVLILDLDRFKLINDAYGHAAGDELILWASEKFRDVLPESMFLARLAGDEFAVLVTDQFSVGPEAVGEVLLAALDSPISLTTSDVRISVSIGGAQHTTVSTDGPPTQSSVTESAQPNCDPTLLMKLAHDAMRKAKAGGRGHVVMSSMLGDMSLLSDVNLEAAIDTALLNNEFEVYLQPIVEFTTDNIIGFESLIRWRHPEFGLISPAEFIGFAEDSGQISAIDFYMLTRSKECLDEFRRGQREDISINVNISASLLSRPGWLDGPISENITEGLNVEVTERQVIADASSAVSTLVELQSRGARVFIDDFGIGYSSLSYLQLLPFDVIKIDKSFIDGLGVSEVSHSLIKLLVALSETMEVDLLAEGIEEPEQLEIVKALGVGYGQGYLFAKPMPATEALAFLESGLVSQQN
ncbi:MAG: EAL domain-containing protein [Actinobacteria bacterium]|nr:EAL domain-containing protein [Actinomycetota bacterium]